MDDNANLRVAILSDIHLRDSFVRRRFLTRGLKNIKKRDYDLFVTLGDTTDHGNKTAWFAAQRLLEAVRPAKRSLAVIGNHDTWNRDARKPGQSEIDASLPLFLDFLRKTSGIVSKTAWYKAEVKGVPFIVLGTVGDSVGGKLGDEQLVWLDEALKEAAKSEGFIFVLSHWPLKNTHGLPKTFGEKELNENKCSWGDESDKLNAILQKYDRVVLLSGHSHMGWVPHEKLRIRGFSSVEVVGNILSVNLPCCSINHDGYLLPGYGLDLTVTPDDAVFRLRNFILPGSPAVDKLTIEKK
ncbi:MAG: metallophosphoesterase [Clostridia bacterium]|nr:metallophosphoesterase [Clostridia bacterium]